MLTEVDQRYPVAAGAINLVPHGLRQEDLAAGAGSKEARQAIEAGDLVGHIRPAVLGRPRPVQRHAYPQRPRP